MLSIAFKKWQATAAQTKAEVEAELQEAIQKARWPCGNEEDNLRAEWGRRAHAEKWLHRMTKKTCIQTSGGTPPVSGKPRRWPWFLLFSCVALLCAAVWMFNTEMPDVAEAPPNMEVLVSKGIQEGKPIEADEVYLKRNGAKADTKAVNERVRPYARKIEKEEAETALVPRKESKIALVEVKDRVAKKHNRKAAKAKEAKAKKAEKEKKRLAEEAAKAVAQKAKEAKAKKKRLDEEADKAAAKKELDKLKAKAANDAKIWQSIKTCGASAIGIGISAAFWNVPGMYASAGLCVGHTAYTEASK